MSAAPRSTAGSSARGRTCWNAIRSAKPSGRSGDHALKWGFRSISASPSGSQRATLYGPVPASGRASATVTGLPAGITSALTILCRKSGVALGEMDGHRPGRGVGFDPLGKVASLDAALRDTPDREVVEGAVLLGRQREEARDRRADVLGADRRSGREPDAGAQPEEIRAPIRARLRQLPREVGDQRAAGRAARPPVGDEAVVDEAQVRAEDDRVEVVGLGSAGEADAEGAAAVRGRAAERRGPYRPVDDGERRRAALDRDGPGHAAAPCVDPHHGPVAAVGDPDAVLAGRDGMRLPPHAHRLRHLGLRVDPRHRPVAAVGHPHGACADGDRARRRCRRGCWPAASPNAGRAGRRGPWRRSRPRSHPPPPPAPTAEPGPGAAGRPCRCACRSARRWRRPRTRPTRRRSRRRRHAPRCRPPPAARPCCSAARSARRGDPVRPPPTATRRRTRARSARRRRRSSRSRARGRSARRCRRAGWRPTPSRRPRPPRRGRGRRGTGP